MRKTFVLRGHGNPETLVVEGRAGSWRLTRGDVAMDATVVRLPDGRVSIILSDGRQISGRVLARPHGEIEVSTSRGICRFGLTDPLHDRVDHAAASLSEDATEEVRALMPGRVIQVAVASGDRVQAGSLLLVLEAMKMQNEIRAERAGVVADVDVSPGDAVDGGARMLTVQSVLD